jgi:hypothetical protein
MANVADSERRDKKAEVGFIYISEVYRVAKIRISFKLIDERDVLINK